MATGSIIKDVAKAAKAKAVKGISSAVFGKGLIGGALGKSFQKKFGDQEEENTDVANALKEQESVQDNNNATLTRIETIVMNIADNIYNIAGVLNAQVVSMKEAHRLQQERAFKSAAAAEEANAEALQVDAPSPAAAATTENTAKEKKGGITDLIGSVLSTKKLFKGFLKKFAIFAAGATAIGLAGFAASTMMSKKDAETPEPPTQGGAPAGPNEPQVISSTPPSAPSGGNSMPAPPAAPTQSSAPTPGDVQPPAPQAGSTPQPNKTPTSTAPSAPAPAPAPAPSAPAPAPAPSAPAPAPAPSAPAPAPTPAAPPPSVAASAPAKDPEMAKLEEYFDKPENAAERAQLEDVHKRQVDIKNGIKVTKEMMQGPQTPEEKTRNETILKLLEPRLEATKKEKKAILDKARQSVQQTPGTPAAPAAAGGAAPSGGGSMPGATPSAGGGVSSAPGPAAASGGGGGASPVPPSPSSGASIGTASASVAAASESTAPKVSTTQINNDTTSGESPPPTAIPSPIAGRGSLDDGTVFGSGS